MKKVTSLLLMIMLIVGCGSSEKENITNIDELSTALSGTINTNDNAVKTISYDDNYCVIFTHFENERLTRVFMSMASENIVANTPVSISDGFTCAISFYEKTKNYDLGFESIDEYISMLESKSTSTFLSGDYNMEANEFWFSIDLYEE
ncbi:hypothetical protein LJB88_03125 [Erysipelotrichaceae bacterium OttesenSCG-928-M19]|nr:hypothetical protein [Erysipelotrichaceae bacterium OttesenSCG-928-M19]